jgi:hypothetical protein
MSFSMKLPLSAAYLAVSALPIALAPSGAWADPPATVATCAGIKAAYPILGTQCENNYAKVNHAPANAQQRLSTFQARKAVLIIFRKAALCNGLYGATTASQARFLSGEQGHVVALNALQAAQIAAADPTVGTLPDLNDVSVTKQQCK